MIIAKVMMGFCVFAWAAGTSTASTPRSAPTETEITLCEKDSDCVIVPHRHCCGSTKKGIHKKYKELYEKTPAWQKYDGQDCMLMGACAPDDKIKKAVCWGEKEKRCMLRHQSVD